MRLKFIFVSTVIGIDAFFIGYALGLNSKAVQIVDASLPPYKVPVLSKPAETKASTDMKNSGAVKPGGAKHVGGSTTHGVGAKPGASGKAGADVKSGAGKTNEKKTASGTAASGAHTGAKPAVVKSKAAQTKPADE